MLFIKRNREVGAYFHLLVMVGRWSGALRGMNGRRDVFLSPAVAIVSLLTRKVASFGCVSGPGSPVYVCV